MMTLEQWAAEVMTANGLSADQTKTKTSKQRTPPRGNRHDTTKSTKIPEKHEVLGKLHRK